MALKKATKSKKLIFGLVVLFLFIIIGLSYILLPLENKILAHLDFGLTSGWHLVIGSIIILIGVVFLIISILTDIVSHVNRLGQRYWFVFILMDIGKWIIIVLLGAFFLAGSYGVAQSVIP